MQDATTQQCDAAHSWEVLGNPSVIWTGWTFENHTTIIHGYCSSPKGEVQGRTEEETSQKIQVKVWRFVVYAAATERASVNLWHLPCSLANKQASLWQPPSVNMSYKPIYLLCAQQHTHSESHSSAHLHTNIMYMNADTSPSETDFKGLSPGINRKQSVSQVNAFQHVNFEANCHSSILCHFLPFSAACLFWFYSIFQLPQLHKLTVFTQASFAGCEQVKAGNHIMFFFCSAITWLL